jgi:hypothetical protein
MQNCLVHDRQGLDGLAGRYSGMIVEFEKHMPGAISERFEADLSFAHICSTTEPGRRRRTRMLGGAVASSSQWMLVPRNKHVGRQRTRMSIAATSPRGPIIEPRSGLPQATKRMVSAAAPSAGQELLGCWRVYVKRIPDGDRCSWKAKYRRWDAVGVT